jgi:poly-gamma-glutamate synthase PgsB/CapB
VVIMKLILFLLIVVSLLGLAESWRHRRCRRRIPIRIHVNGSRGKSSVTRLVAAGLRAGGMRVAAKTTGSAARFIHTDGRESPVQRRGGPNIREQLAVFRRAAGERAQALVLECMAVRPDLQRISEEKIVQSTLGIITNVRPDHLEVMGPHLADVADSLGGTIPRRGLLLTTEETFGPQLGAMARRKGSRMMSVAADDVTPEELAGLGYLEFADNLALALAACVTLGVPRERALAGMQRATPDPGALTCRRCRHEGGELTFINAFAANDPVSYNRIWHRLGLRQETACPVVVINLRADRQRRTRDLVPLVARELTCGPVMLIGDDTRLFADRLRRTGFPPERINDLGGQEPARIWQRLLALTPPEGCAVGIGNIGGAGGALLAFLETVEVAA